MTTITTTKSTTISPDMAKKWLGKNLINRSVRQKKVDEYAVAMKSGKWTVNDSAICLDPDGYLLNGQHRLLAIIDANVSIVQDVKYNVPRDAMKNMDQGAKRSVADALSFAGYSACHSLASIAKMVILVRDGRIYSDNKKQIVSHNDILDFVSRHEKKILEANAAAGRYRGIGAPPTAIGTAYWLIAETAGADAASNYFGRILSRTNEPAGSPVLAVDSRIRELIGRKTPVRNYVYLFIKGYNYLATERNEIGRAHV